jgi:hypothetical protein
VALDEGELVLDERTGGRVRGRPGFGNEVELAVRARGEAVERHGLPEISIDLTAPIGTMTWRGWSPSALTIPLNEQANEVSFATDNADAAYEALRARGVDADAEVLRLGEGVPAMFTFRDQDGNRYRVVERD